MSDQQKSSFFGAWPVAVSAVIFDWAGTILDFGCIAPVAAFREAFTRTGVAISEAEAREPMGAAKREHVELILAQSAVQTRWLNQMGQASTQADVDRIYEAFLQIDAAGSARYSTLIPGALETVSALRRRGVAIGSTTGYPRSIMDMLMPLAQAQGYCPDHCVTVSEVAHGRPWPDMPLANLLALNAPDVRGCVVVDDSPSGLLSARAAGMWAVGISVSGNEVGLSLDDWNALDDRARSDRRDAACRALRNAGAHYVIDSVADLIPVIEDIEQRLAAGDQP
ncbi:phosphonoacetaldehyde hydrolase [Sandaracinobacter neustonicus]|uniref:Phosphonoacetaldehyde hydrolase n=1 Tax=Sandaracinobacter neustonicus TaxID=1715348 RepID=A0A501XLK2_9SPHN|nr:phosphonoacetaldehyde hydrolase [Sandaracinobacter neustonicus]TPE61551.1 phosphonoacetaldehyde hydrolase [Sandaracinobacter neustonicus]